MKSNGAPTPPPSTPPYQVLTTRATLARCAQDYADAAQHRGKPQTEAAR